MTITYHFPLPQAMIDRLFQPKRRAVALAIEKQRLWDEQNKNKQEMLYNKRVRVTLHPFDQSCCFWRALTHCVYFFRL